MYKRGVPRANISFNQLGPTDRRKKLTNRSSMSNQEQKINHASPCL